MVHGYTLPDIDIIHININSFLRTHSTLLSVVIASYYVLLQIASTQSTHVRTNEA